MITARYPKLALFGLSLFAFTVLLDETIVSTALPSIQQSLHATAQQLQLLLGMFFVAVAALSIFFGRLADLIGFARLLYPAMLVFVAACVGAGMSVTIDELLFFRALLALCVAVTLTLPVSVIVQLFGAKSQQKMLGVFSFIRGSGLVLGPLAGGVLLSYFAWPSIFYCTIPFAFMALLLCWLARIKQATLPDRPAMPWGSGAFLAISLAALMLLLNRLQFGWYAIDTVLLALAVISVIALVWCEKRAAQPIILLSLFHNIRFTATLVAAVVMGAFMSCLLFLMPLYCARVLDLSNAILSYYMLLLTSAVMVVSLLFGICKNVMPLPRLFCVLLLGLMSVAVLIMTLPAEYSAVHLVLICLLMGVSWGVMNVALTLSVVNNAGAEYRSTAVGMLYTFFNIGGALALTAAASVLTFTQQRYIMNFLRQQQIVMSLSQRHALRYAAGHAHKLQTWIAQTSLRASLHEHLAKLSWLHGLQAIGYVLLVLSTIGFLLAAKSAMAKSVASVTDLVD